MSWFKLDKAIGSNFQVSPKDLANTKKALNQLGYYNVPEHRGLDDWTDDATFDGIRAFQKDNKLKIDGFMRPGGPTETAINQRLANFSGAPGEEPPGGAMYQCSRCGAWRRLFAKRVLQLLEQGFALGAGPIGAHMIQK